MSKSKTVSYIASKIPQAFSKESVENMITSNSLSWESANSIIGSIEAYTANMSLENDGPVHVKTASTPDMGIAEDALKASFASIKFNALLKMIEDDDTLAYDEFCNIDNARNKIMAEIISKHENDLNILLNELKTTGADASEIDNLINTKLAVMDIA